jgi:acetoin utilization deacetylase AcuC-like enzyme
MNIYEPHWASINEMCMFHSEDYLRHLKRICPSVYSELAQTNANDIL